LSFKLDFLFLQLVHQALYFFLKTGVNIGDDAALVDETQLAAIRDLGDLRIDLKSLSGLDPSRYNGTIMDVMDKLGDIAKSSQNPRVQQEAIEAAARYARNNSGDYKLGFLGRRAPEVFEDVYYNASMPDSTRHAAHREMDFAYQQAGIGPAKPFRPAETLRAANMTADSLAAESKAYLARGMKDTSGITRALPERWAQREVGVLANGAQHELERRHDKGPDAVLARWPHKRSHGAVHAHQHRRASEVDVVEGDGATALLQEV
jgi:hypothetical protein